MISPVSNVGRTVRSGYGPYRLAFARSSARARTGWAPSVLGTVAACLQCEDLACRRRARDLAAQRISVRGSARCGQLDRRRRACRSGQEPRLARPLRRFRRGDLPGYPAPRAKEARHSSPARLSMRRRAERQIGHDYRVAHVALLLLDQLSPKEPPSIFARRRRGPACLPAWCPRSRSNAPEAARGFLRGTYPRFVAQMTPASPPTN